MALSDIVNKVKSKFSGAKASVRNYFTRKKQPEIIQEPEGRERPYGNPHEVRRRKRGFVQRVLGGAGKLFGNLALWGYTIGTLGIGPAVSYYKASPEAPVWPFLENRDNFWRVLQNFDGSPGRVVPPTETGLFNTIIEKEAELHDVDGKKVENKIPAFDIERDLPEFSIVTGNGYNGTVRFQYVYNVPTARDAAKYFYNLEGKISLVDNLVHQEISRDIQSKTWNDIKKFGELQRTNYEKFADEDNKDIETINQLRSENGKPLAHIFENLRKVREDYGVNVLSIVISNYQLGSEALEIESTISRAKADAEAQLIKADADRMESIKQAKTSKATSKIYREVSRGVAEEEEPVRQMYTMHYKMDGYQQIANTGGGFAVIDNNSTMPGYQPIFMPVDLLGKKPASASPAKTVDTTGTETTTA